MQEVVYPVANSDGRIRKTLSKRTCWLIVAVCVIAIVAAASVLAALYFTNSFGSGGKSMNEDIYLILVNQSQS